MVTQKKNYLPNPELFLIPTPQDPLCIYERKRKKILKEILIRQMNKKTQSPPPQRLKHSLQIEEENSHSKNKRLFLEL